MLHLIKLAVGAESLADLRDWQQERAHQMQQAGMPVRLAHLTRQMPKQAEELLDGGSIYWVVKGVIRARQKLLALETLEEDGQGRRCAIVYDFNLIEVAMRPRKAFQGWRYLKPEDAPPDLAAATSVDEMPETMKAELAALGLL